eukprot:764022-Hanusia_phi.AAC.5
MGGDFFVSPPWDRGGGREEGRRRELGMSQRSALPLLLLLLHVYSNAIELEVRSEVRVSETLNPPQCGKDHTCGMLPDIREPSGK